MHTSFRKAMNAERGRLMAQNSCWLNSSGPGKISADLDHILENLNVKYPQRTLEQAVNRRWNHG